jgi:hypothetical protein
LLPAGANGKTDHLESSVGSAVGSQRPAEQLHPLTHPRDTETLAR